MKTLLAIQDSYLKELFFHDSVIKKLHAFSDVTWYESTEEEWSSDGLARLIGEYDACLTSWGTPFFTREVLANASKLKFIGHVAGSPTSVVDERAFHQDITVATANTVLAKSTAEAAFALMMAGAWDLHGYSTRLKRGQWGNNSRDTVMGVSNQVIGLIGLGEISKNVIRMLSGFPVRIKLASRYCTEEQARALGVELCSLEEVLQTSQIISLHSTLTPSTVGFIGKREFALIQDGALFVNTARAKIVDENAMMDELQSGRIFAALDVYHEEPVAANHPLHSLENVLCVPHIGGFASTFKRSMGEFVVDNLQHFTRGEKELPGVISLEEYGRMTTISLQ
ncbi:hydroxyacid dehydrogenase [Paenibacillus qinlingensis]|uniref:hydroxyacid dehydrogenase n=1 Tax=Paenibacillus qinlingensis TaxID=1837343 RepID=UPI001563DD49|nr:hydroxyacid dehydrogenase [Paenibacillus qinlingensis]NQX58651.1 hydroxyacid dehydrogenase [Paenibacillus qinlingensis]